MNSLETEISDLFGIRWPIIQGGMIWCAGWELAAAVSNAGGLGLLGSGSMDPDVLRIHIQKTRQATQKPFGVNVPLIYRHASQLTDILIEEGIKIVFTSAGNPKTWTRKLKDKGMIVAHVVSSAKFAVKSAEAGVDAVVAEGFEAGGHNGTDESTSMTLIPEVRKAIDLPLIAAGGIATGMGIMAALALGADGVQMGSRFAASEESSAHPDFKKEIVNAMEGDTRLALKHLIPVRLLNNKFYREIREAESRGASREELINILGKGRARMGMFEGDMEEGELEIGQVAAAIHKIQPVSDIFKDLIREFESAGKRMENFL